MIEVLCVMCLTESGTQWWLHQNSSNSNKDMLESEGARPAAQQTEASTRILSPPGFKEASWNKSEIPMSNIDVSGTIKFHNSFCIFFDNCGPIRSLSLLGWHTERFSFLKPKAYSIRGTLIKKNNTELQITTTWAVKVNIRNEKKLPKFLESFQILQIFQNWEK